MSKSSLRRILDQELVSKSLACTRILMNALDLFLFPVLSQDISLKPRSSLNNYKDVVVLIGYEPRSDENDDDKINCFVLGTMTWESLPAIPFYNEYHDTAVCRGLLYAVGEFDSTSVIFFNPKLNGWSTLDTKLNCRDCTVTSFDDKLFVRILGTMFKFTIQFLKSGDKEHQWKLLVLDIIIIDIYCIKWKL